MHKRVIQHRLDGDVSRTVLTGLILLQEEGMTDVTSQEPRQPYFSRTLWGKEDGGQVSKTAVMTREGSESMVKQQTRSNT